jgi:heme A synthase
MKLWTYFDERAKRLGLMDTKLLQGAVMCLTVVIVKMFPGILNISAGWFIAAALLLAIKPVMTVLGSDPKS